MALRGLKGGGFVTYKRMEQYGLTDSDFQGKDAESIRYLLDSNEKHAAVINEPMTLPNGKLNFNAYKTLQTLNQNGGQMAKSVADEYFPKGTKVTFINTDGKKNEFVVNGYTYKQNGMTGDNKKAVIPTLTRISGTYGITPGYGSKKPKDSMKTMRDIAFSGAFAKGTGAKVEVRVEQP